MNNTAQKAGWLAIALVFVAGAEGFRTAAYRDPVGIPTICFGETKGVRMGQTATRAECERMLAESLAEADHHVQACIRAPMTDERRAALVSFTYNVGGAAMCKSTLAKKMNAGDIEGGCNELSRWTKAKGITLPGLVKRREAERQMCLKGLT